MAKKKRAKRKKRTGRPKLKRGQGMEVTIRLRVSVALSEAFREASEEEGVTMSRYIRDLLTQGLDF